MSPAEERQDPPSPRWPVWQFDSGYAELARYVVPAALGDYLDVPAVLDAEEEKQDDADRLRAARIYEQLCNWEIKYDREPWAPREWMQQIRHPWWIFNGQIGNCLDLSLLFTGYCLAKGVGALLAFTETHAFIVLTPGRLDEPGARRQSHRVDGFRQSYIAGTRTPDPGVCVGTGADLEAAIAAEGLIPVNAVGVCTEGSDFETAVGWRAWWDEDGGKRPDRKIWLVDVAYLQSQDGFAELPRPTDFEPVIRPYGVGGQVAFKDFEAHRKVIADLRDATGLHALIGPSGRGKSTLARHLAEAKRDGATWFLDASDRRALVNSLAQARMREEGRTDQHVPAVERSELSSTALGQLRAEGSWRVVLDNADGDPRALRDLLVEPQKNQLLLVTSTNEDWAGMPNCIAHFLPPVPAKELGAAEEAGELIDGRPLVSEALARLPQPPARLPAPPDSLATELRGPAVYWDLLRDSSGFGESELKVSALSAYLPANGHPVAALAAALPGAAGVVDFLVERGLLTRDLNGRDVRMHRLFGAAIRHQLERDRPELCDEVVRLATTVEAVRNCLDEQGDLVTVERLDQRLTAINAATPDPDHALGIALHGVAGLLELHGHTRQSGAAYARAKRHLGDDPVRLADCLHSQARTVNQHQTKDRAALEEAIEWADEGRKMLLAAEGKKGGAEEATADRFLAMKGLLMKPLAEFPVPGKTKMDLLRDALEVIEEADRRRQKSTAISDAEKARSHFNLAGIRIPMAKAEPEQAAAHLQKAHDVYEEVGERRRALYGRSLEHPHIAACEFGLGLVGYYRATLVPASRSQRSEWLREATVHAVESLRQRGILDGAVDSEEASKSAALLVKIALARQASPVATPDRGEAVFAEAKRELIGSGMVLEPVPPLPPGREGLIEAIDAWARSKSLRELVFEWDKRPPAEASLPELLDWLEEFSTEWDFRRGERNVVKVPQLTQINEKVIAVTARTLGLIGGGGWRKGRYDHVLILGGMARGCLSRPRRAAKPIAEEELEAASITALGAFRDLGEAEVDLVREVAGATAANEYEAMDLGTRQAFGLGSPRGERGEDSSVLGASWRVREYEGEGGLPVNVVAAPSGAPGERRANTPETFAWFATELAELRPGQRLLIVTTDIYVPYQHADALRLLALPYEVEVDVVGVEPGKVDPRLAHAFQPHNYLQETRSTILSLRRLHAALLGEATSA